MTRSLRQIAEAIDAQIHGDGSVEIEGVASIASALPSDLVFVADEKHLLPALQSNAGAVIAGDFATASTGKPLLISKNPKLAFARAAFFCRTGIPALGLPQYNRAQSCTLLRALRWAW